MIDKIKKAIKNFLQKLRIIFNKEATIIIDEEFGGGLIGIGEKDTDYVLGSDIDMEEELNASGINNDIVYEYNQAAQYKTRNWCTIYSAVTQLAHLKNYNFSLSEIEEIGDAMIKDGKLDPDRGAYLSDAIDYTRRWWNNKFSDRLILSFKIDFLNNELLSAIDRSNYAVQFGYRTSGALRRDIQDDGIADKKTYSKFGGHAVTRFKTNTIDNYIGAQEYNRYIFTYFVDLIKDGTIFRNGYLFLNKR